MPKKKIARKVIKNSRRVATRKSNAAEKIQNDIQQGLGAFNFGLGGFPENQGTWFTPQVSNVTTSFINLRYYLVSNFRQFLNEAYAELGIIQAVVDTPVDDGLRGGIEIQSKDLEEEQIAFLINSLDRDDDINTAGKAGKWNRLFGGAGILVLTDQDPEKPLVLEAIDENTPLEFRAVDMWELFWDKQNTEGYDPAIQSEDFEFYNYYGEQVHKSRIMRLTGITAPSFIRPRLRGWGLSVCERLIRSLNQYLKATDVAFEIMDEFKVDVYKIKNLVNTLMSPLGEQEVKRRIAISNYMKNYQRALVLDAEDEWDHKQVNFSGMKDSMEGIRMQVASDVRMPMTKLFGVSSAGFNSGEDDIEVYNAMVESEVRNKLKYPILRMVEIKCQKYFGFVPNDLSISFKPLREESSEQQQNVKSKKTDDLLKSLQAGAITLEEFRDAANRGKLFDVQLDPQITNTGGYLSDKVKEGANKPYDPQDIDNPGADRLDTRKSRATEVGGAGKEPVMKQPAPRSADAPMAKAQIKSPIDDRQKNAIVFPKPFTRLEKILRTLNSARFDIAAYEADGGDNWIDSRRKVFFENPGNVDESLWERAKEASKAAFKGQVNWKFVTWWYKRQGGKFS